MTRPQTAFFFLYHQGRGGGNWLLLLVNNHPAGMSMLGEIPKPSQLDFAGRGIPKSDYDKEVAKFFEDRIYYGDVAIGICKSFHPTNIKWAKQRMGDGAARIVQVVRNPIHRFVCKGSSKVVQGANWFKHLHGGRAPESEREVYEGVSAYFAQNYFEKFLRRTEFPIIRLEDINRSMNKDFGFFKRLMEWLTQTEWPQDYLQHIHDNWTPAYNYNNWVEWDAEGRCCKVGSAQRPRIARSDRDWSDDPEPGVCWRKIEDWHLGAYLKYNSDCQRRLGYNQTGPGTVETDWEFRGKYPWGEV